MRVDEEHRVSPSRIWFRVVSSEAITPCEIQKSFAHIVRRRIIVQGGDVNEHGVED
jgi:uncharacterized protein with ACT and thioredoxin-like domain